MSNPNPMLVAQMELQLQRLKVEVAALEGTHDPRALRNLNARLRTARLGLARLRGRHTRAEWAAILAETGGICVRCGDHPHRICKGYVEPLAAGGSDSVDNLQPLCPPCVSAKQAERINWLARWRETQSTGPDST